MVSSRLKYLSLGVLVFQTTFLENPLSLKIYMCKYTFRLQCSGSEQYSEARDHSQAYRDPEAGHSFWDLHPAEQSALCGSIQPGCCHLPGDVPAEDPHHSPVLSVNAGPEAGCVPVALPAHPHGWGRTCAGPLRKSSCLKGPSLWAWWRCWWPAAPVASLGFILRRSSKRPNRTSGSATSNWVRRNVCPGVWSDGDVCLRWGESLRIWDVQGIQHNHLDSGGSAGTRRAGYSSCHQVCRQHPEGLCHITLHHPVNPHILFLAAGLRPHTCVLPWCSTGHRGHLPVWLRGQAIPQPQPCLGDITED